MFTATVSGTLGLLGALEAELLALELLFALDFEIEESESLLDLVLGAAISKVKVASSIVVSGSASGW